MGGRCGSDTFAVMCVVVTRGRGEREGLEDREWGGGGKERKVYEMESNQD